MRRQGGIFSPALIAWLLASSSLAGSALFCQAAFAQDKVLDAMHDELDRSFKQLQVSNKAKPYYIRYEVTDSEWLHESWQSGAKMEESRRKERRADVEMRVGSFAFDNNSRIPGYTAFDACQFLPVDDDNVYGIRHGLWLLTDDAYKHATEQLEKLDTYRQGHALRNLCESFSQEAPRQILSPLRGPLSLKDDWSDRIRRVSLVFKEFPDIRKAWVSIDAENLITRNVNTEGSITRTVNQPVSVSIAAYVMTQDGAEIWDSDYVRGRNESEIPAQAELENLARKLGQNLSENGRAERMDYYFGPVLFEGQSAAELVGHGIAPLLVANPGDNFTPHNTLIRSLNSRILPSFLSVYDDPYLKTYKGKNILDLWTSDSDAMPCQKVQLVDHGFLRNLISSRVPVYAGEHSNGHNISGEILPTTLVVEAQKTLSPLALRKKLIELAKQKGLKEALIVRRIIPHTSLSMGGTSSEIRAESMSDYNPSALFSVDVETGEEKRVRGLKFGVFDRARMESIIAAANDSQAYFTVNWYGSVHNLVTPSLLVNDIELEEDTEPTFSTYPLESPPP